MSDYFGREILPDNYKDKVFIEAQENFSVGAYVYIDNEGKARPQLGIVEEVQPSPDGPYIKIKGVGLVPANELRLARTSEIEKVSRGDLLPWLEIDVKRQFFDEMLDRVTTGSAYTKEEAQDLIDKFNSGKKLPNDRQLRDLLIRICQDNHLELHQTDRLKKAIFDME